MMPTTFKWMGTAGNMTVSSASRATPGTFAGSVSNVRFDEWDFNLDRAVSPGGRCVIVPSGSITASF